MGLGQGGISAHRHVQSKDITLNITVPNSHFQNALAYLLLVNTTYHSTFYLYFYFTDLSNVSYS